MEFFDKKNTYENFPLGFESLNELYLVSGKKTKR